MNTYHEAGDHDDIAVGDRLIAAGKVGCIVLSGGDGSRLGWDGPKGTFPITRDQTLFDILQENYKKACAHFGRELKLAIMTSPLNDESTREAFSVGVDFFTQNMLPLLDLQGNPLEEMRPNGNGEVLKCFCSSGLFEKWQNAGVEFVQVILVDNPLAIPFDPNQMGIQFKCGAEVCLKAVQKKSFEEKVGVVGEKEGKICVIEYSENPPQEWNLANTGLFSFSMGFIQKVKDAEIPLHPVERVFQGKPVIKRECFLFDILQYAEAVEVILYPRKTMFAPLKSREDILDVQRALLQR